MGHVTRAATGVTAVVLPPGTVGAGEVRGGAPASRETALLAPTKLVQHVDAVVLSGGSAFGLATADGVMRWCAEQGRGYRTTAGPVPIVPAAAVFDLVTSAGDRPDAEDGYRAAAQASASPVGCGRVGAGRGATVGKWHAPQYAVPGGLGSTSARVGDATVGALAVVNSVGDVVEDDGSVLAGSIAPPGTPPFPEPPLGPGESTTLLVVATDARLDKVSCHALAEAAFLGVARALRPALTRFDGDIAFAVATGVVAPPPLELLRLAASDVVTDSIRRAVVA